MASEPDTAVHLRSTGVCANHVVSLAGLSSLACVPFSVAQVLKGDYLATLFFLAIPLAGVCVGRWIRLRTPSNFAILHADRIELCGVRVLSWSQVQGICWLSSRPGDWDATIELEVRGGMDGLLDCVRIDLAMVSPRDGVKLIRYLRLAGAEVSQDGWPEFCYQYAVPLVERCQRAAPTSGANNAATTCSVWLEVKFFLVGMLLLPLVFVAFIPLCRLADWRLLCWFAAFAIGCLGLLHAIARGWIPADAGGWASIGVLLLLLVSVPFFLRRRKAGPCEAQCTTAPVANALHRWAVYESTSRMPDIAPDDGVTGTGATLEGHQAPKDVL